VQTRKYSNGIPVSYLRQGGLLVVIESERTSHCVSAAVKDEMDQTRSAQYGPTNGYRTDAKAAGGNCPLKDVQVLYQKFHNNQPFHQFPY